jgi:hypothetical protein
MPEALAALVRQWRHEAELLRRRGAQEPATALASCADELEVRLADWEREPVSLEEAARLSGYSVAHLRRLLADGVLDNVAANGGTLLRRGDLPRKPKRALPGPDLTSEVLPLPSRGNGR